MNSKGLQLAISTIVVLAIGILLLIGLVYFVTEGFSQFGSATKPLIDSAEGSAVKQACEISCETKDMFSFCCKDFDIGGEFFRCDDSRLNVECDRGCEAVQCASN